MGWLRQQNKVERLSASAQQQALQMSYSRMQFVQRVQICLQQPATLAWAFAAGTLYGTTQGRLPSISSFEPFRYVNTLALVWSLLAEKQTGAE